MTWSLLLWCPYFSQDSYPVGFTIAMDRDTLGVFNEVHGHDFST